MEKGRLFRSANLAFALVVVLGVSIAPAAAGSWTSRTHPRYHDFFALAPSESSSSAVTHHAGDCFQSNSAVEATRGIRHWTGACAGGH